MAEILFYRLIVICDDFGRTDARPVIVRSNCFPLKTQPEKPDFIKVDDVKKWLLELANNNLIVIYTFECREYLQMVTWAKHHRKDFDGFYIPYGNLRLFTSSLCPECAQKEEQELEAIRLSISLLSARSGDSIPASLRNLCRKPSRPFVKDKKNGNTVKVCQICQDYARSFSPVPYSEYLKREKKAFPSLVVFSTLDIVGVGKTHLVSS